LGVDLSKSPFLSVLLRFGIQPEAKSGLFFSSCVYKCVKSPWKNQAARGWEKRGEKKDKIFDNWLLKRCLSYLWPIKTSLKNAAKGHLEK